MITRAGRFNARHNRFAMPPKADQTPVWWCRECNAPKPRITYLGQEGFCAGCAERIDTYGEAIRGGLEVIARIDPAAADRVCDALIAKRQPATEAIS